MYISFQISRKLCKLLEDGQIVTPENKRIAKDQRKRYKKRCLIGCLFALAIYALLQYYGNRECCFLMVLCMIIIAFNQIIGAIINTRGKEAPLC